MGGPLIQTYSLANCGNPGLTCDDEGLSLGPAILAKVVRDAEGHRRYRLRPPEDMAQLLHLAYGPVPDRVMGRWCHGLARVVELLAAGEAARACIHAVLLGFPEIAHEGMAKLARAASLRKYGDAWEDEPRVPARNPDGGQWTSDGADVQVAAAGDLPCEGDCQSGGSYGTTGMYWMEGKILCHDCAIKAAGAQGLSAREQNEILNSFLLKNK